MKTIRDTARHPQGRRRAVRRDRRLHQRRQELAAQPAHRRRRARREPALRDPRPHGAPHRDRGRPALHARRHRRLRAQPAAPARRGVPLDARGGGRGRPAAARRRRVAPRPRGPDHRGAQRAGRGGRRPDQEIIVVNKADIADPEVLDRLRRHEKHCITVSARTGAGLDELRELIAGELPKPDIEVDVLVPYDRGDLISRIHEEGEILESEHVADGTRLRAKVTPVIGATSRHTPSDLARIRDRGREPCRVGRAGRRSGQRLTSVQTALCESDAPTTERVPPASPDRRRSRRLRSVCTVTRAPTRTRRPACRRRRAA